MGGNRGRLRLVRALVAAATLAPVSVGAIAAEAPSLVVIRNSKYIPGDTTLPQLKLTVSRGQSLVATNVETPSNTHSLLSDQCWLDGAIVFCDGTEPIEDHVFDSGEVSLGDHVNVRGVETLSLGTYTFFCNFHGHTMRGSLAVVE